MTVYFNETIVKIVKTIFYVGFFICIIYRI